jgi:hypothetical protein
VSNPYTQPYDQFDIPDEMTRREYYASHVIIVATDVFRSIPAKDTKTATLAFNEASFDHIAKLVADKVSKDVFSDFKIVVDKVAELLANTDMEAVNEERSLNQSE